MGLGLSRSRRTNCVTGCPTSGFSDVGLPLRIRPGHKAIGIKWRSEQLLD